MRRVTQRIVVFGVILTLFAAVGLRGQDPDGGAGRGRPLAAYRPVRARRARPGDRGPSARCDGRTAGADEGRQRSRRGDGRRLRR